jgi:hypothetical protein
LIALLLALWLRSSLALAPAPSEPAPPAGDVAESPIVVTTRLSPDPSHVGDVLELEVVAAFPRGHSVNLPVGVAFAPLHLVDVEESEPEVTGDGLRKTFRVRLQHFAPGPAEVPSFSLTYVDPAGAVHTVAVPAIAFTVDALLANEPDPERKPEDPPISIEYPNTLAETVIVSVLATTLALVVLGLVLRRVLRRRRPARPVPAIPPHVLALEALAELEKSELLDEGRVQDYYLQLTEIAKAYLERRFGVPALDQTTEEIRRWLLREAAQVEPLTPSELIDFLQRCDLVKFARMHPETDESHADLGFVRDAVERSRPRAEPPRPAAPAANDDAPPSAKEAS